ncbi:pirin family protein [Methanolobus zinderi]|uniref:Pirin family protein n=1 Tax=Methanolobus zinderi TaxID=536044 RepID=A0A7D5EF62_9EURY|nr:pirin family protein [Methanolobus zinderi]KXS43652.1 MAG: Pirin [Methanolobus sp. T82-4]QLC49080.1 pirin family protein [Methanolobus zinderi]
MENTRTVSRIIKSVAVTEGAGVHLRRAFSHHQASETDPFLMLDEFHSDNPEEYKAGFPYHPHRGIDTITYMLAGKVTHSDNQGNEGVIGPGDVQWMTAGSGIVHQEMPEGDENGELWGLQLWVNLPASHKMTEPRYRGIKSEQIPGAHTANGTFIKVICGDAEGMHGPVENITTEIEYMDLRIPANGSFRHYTEKEYTVLAYVLEGKARMHPELGPVADSGSLAIFEHDYWVEIKAEEENARVLLMVGKPLSEPIAWMGSVVMNTEEEARRAFEEYSEGTFTK